VFAYPNGDIDGRTVGLLRSLEYVGAVTTRWGFVTRMSARMFLPRIGVNTSESMDCFRARSAGIVPFVGLIRGSLSALPWRFEKPPLPGKPRQDLGAPW